MDRRTFITGIGCTTIALSGCASTAEQTLGEVQNATSGVVDSKNTEPGVYEFGNFSPGFERAEWTDNRSLEITFSDDHDMDAFGIRYETKSSADDDIMIKESPSYGGSRKVPLLDEMAGTNAPAGTYHLYAYKGTIGLFADISEVIGKVSLDIRPDLEIQTASIVDNTNVSLQISNNGTAPLYLNSVTAAQKASIKSIIGIGESALVRTNQSPFERDEDCVIVPTETNIRLNTAPQLDTSVPFKSPHDEEKRYCTVSF